MSVLTAKPNLVVDGDAAFLRVDNRRPAHALGPGVVASAINQAFDQGKPRPRLGVARDGWGVVVSAADDLVGGGNWDFPENSGYSYFHVLGFVIGATYVFTAGAHETLTTAGQVSGIYWVPGGL